MTRYKFPPRTEHKESMRIKKFYAPKVLVICGKSSQWTPSPCECTDTITCAYCVQAYLWELEKKLKADDKTVDKIISLIKKRGIRKTARDLGVDHSTVKYWIKSRNIPQWVVKKYEGVGE